MKLQHADAAGSNSFTGYGDGYVLVNGERYTASIIVTPDRVLNWEVCTLSALEPGHFEPVLGMALEVVLLGTGARQSFPRPRQLAPLVAAGVGVEVMDVPAACRTFNILAAEARRVAAALLIAPG